MLGIIIINIDIIYIYIYSHIFNKKEQKTYCVGVGGPRPLVAVLDGVGLHQKADDARVLELALRLWCFLVWLVG